MRTVLFLGGQNDGKVLEVANPSRVLRFAQAPPLFLTGVGDVDLEPTVQATPNVETYTLQQLALFSHLVTVGVLDGLPDQERDRLARQYLLSPLARNLLEDH